MGYQNFFATKLFTDIGSSDTVIALEAVPTATSGRLVLEARNPTQREVIKYSGVAGNTITGVTRGQGGTSAKSHLKNSLVQMNATAEDLQDLYDAYNAFSAANNAGWLPLAQTPVWVANNGNNSFDISIPTDLTALLSKGNRLRIPRAVAPGTMSALFPAGTPSANNGAPSGITFTPSYSAEAWIKIDSYPTSHGVIVGRSNGVNDYWLFRVNSDGKLGIYGSNAASPDGVISVQSVPLGRKVHVAATFTVGGTGTIWFDGVAVATTTLNGATTAIGQPAGATLAIGYRPGIGEYFLGGISDVRVWSTVRTQAQIRDNMHKTLVGNEAGLVCYFPLNGNFNDLTANANNLSAGGGAIATNVDTYFSTYAYGIITSTPVFSAGNTTMTVQCPAGFGVPNATLAAASVGYAKTPFNFPSEPTLWELSAFINGSVQTSVGGYQDSGVSIQLPLGAWRLRARGGGMISRATAASGISGSFGLSSLPTALSDTSLFQQLYLGGASSSNWQLKVPIAFDKTVSLAASTKWMIIFAPLATGTVDSTLDFGNLTAEFALL